MPLTLQDFETEALRLPAKDRAKLAQYLIESLDEAEDVESEKLWIEEAERRYQAYKAGKIESRSSDEVFKAARARLKCE